MLRSYYYDNRELSFSTENVLPKRNLFTVVVGKNGTGKSRLLKAIIEDFIRIKEQEHTQYLLSYLPSFQITPTNQINYKAIPNRIIALSTSPFDKFPITRETKHTKGYEYLGLRGLGSQNLSLSFMSRILGSLIRAITENKDQGKTVTQALNYLGYEGCIEARFIPDLRMSDLFRIINSDKPTEELFNQDFRNKPFFLERISRKLHKDSLDLDSDKLIRALTHWYNTGGKPRLNILISSTGVYTYNTDKEIFSLDATNEIDELIVFLLEVGFFRLRDVGLQKQSQPEKIRINDASSGEQCVVMALLGIASHIQDGALICIDEPEICLHPEWQERYIELLMTTFDQFSNCHFIIATHSPQVIAKLEDENCFVLDLESGNTFTGRELNKRSSDFQLANVFKAPGYKNEYLSRELLNALGIIGSGAKLEKEHQKEIFKILTLKDLLNEGDPVKNLMSILEASLKEIGAE